MPAFKKKEPAGETPVKYDKVKRVQDLTDGAKELAQQNIGFFALNSTPTEHKTRARLWQTSFWMALQTWRK